jgi:segregation and condensation protein B
MSLKAKIEAVIYASEEPVTLIQLVSLLGEEAQAELAALAARQESLPLDEAAEPGDPDALNAEALAPPEPTESQAADSPGPAPAPVAESSEAAATDDAKAATRAANQESRRLRDYFRSILDELIADYATSDRGLEIREVAGGFRLATKPEYHDAVRGFVKSLKPPLKLSLQALETLAVIAYKQPVTAPEVSEIRGVDSSGVLGSLMARKLIVTAGRKPVIGRPILYKTTKDFLVRFGLKDINELPSIEEFEKMSAEFAEAIQEEFPMAASTAEAARRSEEDATAIANMHEAQPDGEPYSEENLSEENPTSAVVDPADNAEIDGRISGLSPNYDHADFVEGDEVDSPALDAEVQGPEESGE